MDIRFEGKLAHAAVFWKLTRGSESRLDTIISY